MGTVSRSYGSSGLDVPDLYRAFLDDVTEAVTGLSTTGSNVFESPRAAIDAGSLPALAVLARDVFVSDVVESADTDAHLETHRLGIIVQTIATTRDQRDNSSLEVKDAILRVLRPGYQRRYTRTDFEEGREGERDLWVATQRFEIDYHVDADEPGVVVT